MELKGIKIAIKNISFFHIFLNSFYLINKAHNPRKRLYTIFDKSTYFRSEILCLQEYMKVIELHKKMETHFVKTFLEYLEVE